MLSLEQEVAAWDSVLLEPLTEDSFVSNLQQRFKRDHIYTYIGTVLISVNPYKKLALYSADLVRAYMTRGPFHLPPHVYAVAGTAYRWLRDRNEDQCIVVSGESGSGKTEAARIALQFIVLASGNTPEVKVIKDRLVHAGTLLEAFGNAKTHRNDNASRFGKYLDIEFDYKGDPIGGHITHFLLEKSRITRLSQGDRNFHVFYQLLTGADISLLKSLKLQRNVDNYMFLHNGASDVSSARVLNSEGTDDKAHFIFTKTALEVLGFSSDEIVSIFRVVAVVLKLGNVIFVPESNIDGTESCSINNDYELYELCELLGAEVRWFERALTSRSIEVAGGGGLTADLAAPEAASTRNALCKALYSRLFTWLVSRVNDATKVKHYGRRRTLGLLDVYGFESFESNGLETMLVNYCNERLHRAITHATLALEQDEYVREGLEWTRVQFFDNTAICELIDKNNHGILTLLEEPHVQSDESFLMRLQQCCAGHSHCLLNDSSLPPQCFQIRHYAGPVMYSVHGFVEKNSDFLHRDVSRVMYRCEHPLLKILFPEGNPKRCAVKKPATVGTQFKIAMDALVKNLSSRQAHYIRCIKPNELKQPRIFEMALVQHQVRYQSLMETVLVRRAGYSHRLTYSQFLSRYRMLSRHTWPRWRGGTPVEASVHLVRALPVPSAEFSFGRTKIFIRSPRTVFDLEGFRAARLHDLALLIQKIWRGYRLRKRYLLMKRSQIIIAAAWRSWRECQIGVPFQGRRHLWCLYRVAREEYRILKHRKQVDWAVRVIQRHYVQWKRRQFLLRLPLVLPADSDSPVCRNWPPCPPSLTEASLLLRKIHHKWRCHKYRIRFDQTARNRMREKVTASIIFKDRKASYPRSVSHPFLGDYVRLRQNIQWKKISIETNDQYVVFADIINKITRSSGKFVPILLVVSTSAMLILDQRTLQVKYRVPATEIYRLSLSPYLDDVAVFHVRASSPVSSGALSVGVTGCTGSGASGSDTPTPTGCLFQSDLAKKKGDFVFQTGHVIEIVTKLFLVIQNAVGKAPEVNISTEFEANFGQQTVVFTFKCTGLPEVQPGQIRVLRKGNKMEVLV